MVAVLKAVREHGLPKNINRQALKRARVGALPTNTPVGALWSEVELVLKGGKVLRIPAVNPIALLWATIQRCPAYAAFLHDKLEAAEHGHSKPARIYIYYDEILPGNALAHNNVRKLAAFYWALGECDKQISREEVWHHLLAVRASKLKDVIGGPAQVFKKAVSLFFTEPYDLRKGVLVPFPSQGNVMIYGMVSMVVGDEVALKQIWSFKGSSGTMMCFACRNIVNHHSDLDEHDSTNSLVPSYSPSLDRVVLHDDASILANANYLAAQKNVLPKTKFERLEQALGLVYTEEGGLWCDRFLACLSGGVVSCTCYDWMHVLLVSGTWNTETGLLRLVCITVYCIQKPACVCNWNSTIEML